MSQVDRPGSTMNISLRYEWIAVESAPGVPYCFPEEMNREMRVRWGTAALYRWVVPDERATDCTRLYVGEAEHLTRRIHHNLHPSPSQSTNLRLNASFSRESKNGKKIILQALRFDSFDFQGLPISMADLSQKLVRRLLESLFLVYYFKAGYTVLNA
jgi:hypothetical protein